MGAKPARWRCGLHPIAVRIKCVIVANEPPWSKRDYCAIIAAGSARHVAGKRVALPIQRRDNRLFVPIEVGLPAPAPEMLL